jgi:hypothetical protein
MTRIRDAFELGRRPKTEISDNRVELEGRCKPKTVSGLHGIAAAF